MAEEAVIIIGAGVAGLAAAEVLGREHIPVTLLEARERIGGRIYTVTSKSGNLPIELGAEFVHGAKNAVWEIIGAGQLATQEAPDRHWQASERTLNEDNRFWDQLREVFSRIDTHAPDQDFQSFLKSVQGVSRASGTLAREYVEGFHAADPARVSVHSLSKAESAAERDEGNRQFHIAKGYQALLDWFWRQLAASETDVRFGTVVDAIRWQRGSVEVEARSSSRHERFKARQALVALPLGVLQKQGLGGVVLDPNPPAKERAIRALAMGAVVKIMFQFRERFWPIEDLGFIHASGSWFPTWWSDQRGPLLTGWVGGPRADQLAKESPETIQAEAVRALAGIFRTECQRVEELLLTTYHHDWGKDLFAKGAYSYTPAGMGDMAAQIAAPLEGTLFFAGEATDSDGEQGTVQGALASGRRAAQEILRVLRRNRATLGQPPGSPLGQKEQPAKKAA